MALYEVLEDGTIVPKAGKTVGNLDCLRTNVLWTNPNPTSDFTGKTITLSSDDYDYLVVLTLGNKSYTYFAPTVTIPKGQGGRLVFADTSSSSGYKIMVNVRDVTRVSDTQYTISECRYSHDTTYESGRNDLVIPYQILGIKKQPSMIYTGKELFAGNGVKIENGTISSEHPIGSYYICKTGSSNPASLFGGTWKQIRTNVALPLGGTAKVITSSSDYLIKSTNPLHFRKSDGSDTNASPSGGSYLGLNYNNMYVQQANSGNNKGSVYPVNLIADFTTASSVLYVDIWEREA